MRRNNKRRNRLFVLLLVLLAVTVGFAMLSTRLKINGTSRLNKSAWNIHWDNVANRKGVTPITAAYIKDTAKTIVEYEILLQEPGDYYEFTVDAVNEGTLDGEITEIVSTVNGQSLSTLPPYIKYSVTYSDGSEVKVGDFLGKKFETMATKKTYKVRVEYDREIVEIDDVNDMDDEGLSLVFNFSVKYSQVVPSGASESDDLDITLAKQDPTSDTIEPGDLVTIKVLKDDSNEKQSEQFYVVSSNNSKTVLLSKYNLLVGNIVETEESDGILDISGQIPLTTPGYGLQSADAKGSGTETSFKGTVAFSGINYWNISGSSYPKSVYSASYRDKDGTYNNDKTHIDSGSADGYSVAYYVENYVKKLKQSGMPGNTIGRLLTLDEAVSLGCTTYSCTSAPAWVSETSYWLGTAYNYRNVYRIRRDSNLLDSGIRYDSGDYNGVRPVIEIPTRLLKRG